MESWPTGSASASDSSIQPITQSIRPAHSDARRSRARPSRTCILPSVPAFSSRASAAGSALTPATWTQPTRSTGSIAAVFAASTARSTDDSAIARRSSA